MNNEEELKKQLKELKERIESLERFRNQQDFRQMPSIPPQFIHPCTQQNHHHHGSMCCYQSPCVWC